MYSSAPNGLCPRHEARMLSTGNSEQQSTRRSRVYAMSVLRLLSACYYNMVSRVTQRGKHPKEKIGGKQKFDSQHHCKNLTSGVKTACREKRRLRSEAQLSQVNISYGRDIGKGTPVLSMLAWRLQLLFFVGDFSLLL